MPVLYLDMDGVLCDFNLRAKDILKATDLQLDMARKNGRWESQDWLTLKKYPNLFYSLPKTDIADELVNLARKFRDELNFELFILTAVPRHNDVPDAFHDKILWIQDHYPDIRVRFGPYSTDKARHAEPGDILVDDRLDNCLSWTQAGGLAIRVIDGHRKPALETLDKIYLDKISLKRLRSLDY